MRLLNIGSKHFINADRIVGIYNLDSNPVRDFVLELRSKNRLFDFTAKKGAKSLIMTSEGKGYLSVLTSEAINNNWKPDPYPDLLRQLILELASSKNN